MSHHTLFESLRGLLAEWREERLLFPPLLLSQERFRAVSVRTLTPLMEALVRILRAAGLEVELSVHVEEEEPYLMLYLAQYEGRICLWPDPNHPTFLCLSAQGGYIGEAPRQWRLSYGITGNGQLDRCLHDAVRRLLEPPR